MSRGFGVCGWRFPVWLAGLFLGLLAALLVQAQGAGPAPVLGVRQEMPNGLVWLFSEQHDLPLVTLNLLVKAGTLRDPAGKEGLANLTAQLLSHGTKKRTYTQIAQELDFLGARFTAYGNDDFAVLSLTVLKKDLAAGLDLFQDMLLHPTFATAEIRRKVSQLQASLQADEDEAGVVAARAFDRRLFGAFPYGHPPKGTRAGLAAIRPSDLVQFHRAFYRPGNAILSLVGDLSPEEAKKWVSQTFGPWEPAPIPPLKLLPLPPLNKSEEVMVDKDITQANIVLGHLGIARANPDFYAFQVMNYILGGGGFASRLMDEIREKRGLAYNVSSSFDPGLEPGAFAVDLETKNASSGEAVGVILQELERIRTRPVSEAELKDAKSYLIGSFPRKMDSLGKRAWLLSYVEFYGLGLDYPWRYPELINPLTPAQIQAVAEKYLHPDKLLLVVVGKKTALPRSLLSSPAEEKKDVTKQPNS